MIARVPLAAALIGALLAAAALPPDDPEPVGGTYCWGKVVTDPEYPDMGFMTCESPCPNDECDLTMEHPHPYMTGKGCQCQGTMMPICCNLYAAEPSPVIGEDNKWQVYMPWVSAYGSCGISLCEAGNTCGMDPVDNGDGTTTNTPKCVNT